MASDVVGKEVWSGSLPCDLASVWAHFWRDELFYESQLALQGNLDVQISPWELTSGTSLERSVEANHEIRVKIPGTPSHAHNSLKQTVTVERTTAPGMLLSITDDISVSGAMYSDHFCVKTHWRVVPEGYAACSLTVVAEVIFLKAFPWHLRFIRNAITSSTFAETSESVAKWYSGAMAKLRVLQPQPRMSTSRAFPPAWFQAANPEVAEVDRGSAGPQSPRARKVKVGKVLLNQVFASRSASTDEGPLTRSPQRSPKHKWYWSEDPDKVSNHDPSSVVAGEWIRFDDVITPKLEHFYRKRKALRILNGDAKVAVDLTSGAVRSSEANGAPLDMSDVSSSFIVDLDRMVALDVVDELLGGYTGGEVGRRGKKRKILRARARPGPGGSFEF